MDNNFELELKGSSNEATTAKQQIAKYFKCYGDSGHQDAKKHQMIFASKIMCVITRCENKHVDIYCDIITEIFADKLSPEISTKYWTIYVNCIRYFHYMFVERKDFERASLIFKHIANYPNKLQSNENSLTCINIYCYQLFLQNSLKSKNQDLAIQEANDVVISLTKLFTEILETNRKQKFQYPDILNKTFSWLFPQNKVGTVYQFLKILPQDNVRQMFQTLFNLYGRQNFDNTFSEVECQEQAKFIIETIYMLLQADIMDKMQLKLAAQLLSYCRIECRLQSYKPIAESFLLLYDYIKLLCQQIPSTDFQRIYSSYCERFKEIFDKYAKVVMNQSWFGNFLVLLFYLHSQLQNTTIFNTFWKQMSKASCYKSMFQLFMDSMKLAPCISSETKLFTINCCTSSRKHIILSFAQVALAAFVFYCQNVSEEGEKAEESKDPTDYYKETIQKNLLLIVNHAFKIIDKMDCITSNSQEMELILTRFKQATLSCKTTKQAGTCIAICELFLKIKTKIPNKEWTLLLRRLYKTTTQQITDEPHLGREIQMCYITSMLQENEIDIGQIRTQISIFYANETTTGKVNEQQCTPLQHDNCLMHLYDNTTSLFRPQLERSRKRLLHWLESQHIVKYYKSNTSLLHSVLKSSKTYYDFVLITKLGKLQTYAMAKITSIYKSLKAKTKELNTLTRLESLTFGHCCVMLLNDMNTNHKIQIDSKDVFEDQLENLLMREEMSTFTIQNDLRCYKLAWEGFKAFEEFYEKFDSEPINMDDAIIDWESILDDLASLALCLQLYGYLEYSSKIWILHYKCSRLLQDTFSALRGLAFFCEYSKHFETNEGTSFQLDEEIQSHFPTLMQGLDNLVNLPRQAYQNYILLAVLQIAHYYARKEKYTFAQMLLQYVEQKHYEIPERQGRYDIVMGTMDAIKFRLLAKHFDETKHEKNKRSTAENLLLHRCLLHEIEETLDRFHEFSFISSNDGLLFSILIIGLVQEMAECSVNRLCDNFINALFIATCKCTLQSGLALRFVQVMGMWMWVNLQMEYVDRAQTKLKIIEYVMGLKSLKELTDKKSKAINHCAELVTTSQYNPGMEAIRRLAQVQLSPIKTDKLQLSPSHRNSDLKRYLKCNIDPKLLPHNEQIEWTFFMVGCLNARLYFLVEDYDQLDMFYEKGNRFLQTRRNSFNKNYYKNIQLMAMQHCANYLRARKQYDKALQCLEYALDMCENMKFYIDAVYYVNFQLQLIATKKEMTNNTNLKTKQMITYSKSRKILNSPPETKQLQEQEKILQFIMASGKKPTTLMRPLPSIVVGSGCSSSKKTKTPAIVTSTLDNNKITKPIPKLKFDICEDSLEIAEIIDDIVSNDVHQTQKSFGNTPEDGKSIKRTKPPEGNEEFCKTPKTIKKTSTKTSTNTKSSVKFKRPEIKPQYQVDIDLTDSPLTKTTTNTKSSVKIKRPEIKPKYQVDIDLTDSPLTSPYKATSTSSSSSLENLETKENLDTNELLEKMQNLIIKSTKKPQQKSTSKTKEEEEVKSVKKRVRKPNLDRQQAIIVLDDSPCAGKSSTTNVSDTGKSSKTRITTRDKSPKDLADNIEDTTGKSTKTRTTTKDKSPKELVEDVKTLTVNDTRPRRQRKLVLDTNTDCPSTAATPRVTRRRQKNLV